MKLKHEEGRFVIEPQTTAEREALMALAGQEWDEGGAEEGAGMELTAGALPWECAVADALGAQLEGMSCDSVERVLDELLRMNAASAGTFDTPARAVPDLPAEEIAPVAIAYYTLRRSGRGGRQSASIDVKKPPQGRPGDHGLADELLFDLIGPNGERWMICLNGTHDGFPPGTSCANYALPLVNAMLGEMKKHGVSFPAQ